MFSFKKNRVAVVKVRRYAIRIHTVHTTVQRQYDTSYADTAQNGPFVANENMKIVDGFFWKFQYDFNFL